MYIIGQEIPACGVDRLNSGKNMNCQWALFIILLRDYSFTHLTRTAFRLSTLSHKNIDLTLIRKLNYAIDLEITEQLFGNELDDK